VGDVFKVGSSSSSTYVSTLNANEEDILTRADEAYYRRLEALRRHKDSGSGGGKGGNGKK